jgi:lipopolysaccharide biosynthesis protein
MGSHLRHLPRVLDVAPVTDVESDSATPQEHERIAFLAHWSPGEHQSRSTLALISELQRLRYRVVVCSTSPAPGRLEFGSCDVRVDELTVLRRPNVGYDFGSWAVAMAAREEFLDRPYVLVLNDSLVGPFAPIDDVIADFEQTTADVWGLVESNQFAPHLQSFFRGFRYGTLAERPMRRFWRDLRVVEDKSTLIAAYEFGFSEFLVRNSFSTAQFVHHSEVVGEGLNPTMYGWRALLDAGVPFVKRELVRSPELVPDGHRLPAVLADHYGTDVADWL